MRRYKNVKKVEEDIRREVDRLLAKFGLTREDLKKIKVRVITDKEHKELEKGTIFDKDE